MSKLRKIFRSIADAGVARDVFFIAGIALISIGAEKIYHPLAWIVPGVVLLVLALAGKK